MGGPFGLLLSPGDGWRAGYKFAPLPLSGGLDGTPLIPSVGPPHLSPPDGAATTAAV
jgi:hypothetical protein